MNQNYILALDQGTSSSRSVLFDQEQNVLGVEQEEFKQFYPKAGWVEHNPHEIWESQFLTAKTLITRLQIDPSDIAAIGITNQRETAVVWDKHSGEPICNAIVWQDKRTSELCNRLKRFGYEEYIKENTGLVIDSYFSATKINWILEHIEGAKEKAEKGDLLFGTVDTWLIWKLSGGKLHITDYSNASRTMIYNIKELKWDENLLTLLKIPDSMLPDVKNSSEIYGRTSKALFGKEIPIAGIAGDQQAALFGQQCFTPGEAKNTYGTGCFLLMNTADHPVRSTSGLLTTIAWGLNDKITYALEGSIFIAGAALKWLRDGIKIINSASDTETMAEKTDSNEGVYFVPAFAGLGAPYWKSDARGIISGLTQGVTENHIVRASLEALAYQTKDILDAMCADSGIQLKELRVDGGASVNNFLLQFQADILQSTVIRPANVETTALGAAYLAGSAAGFWNREALEKAAVIDRVFESKASSKDVEKLYSGWKKAVQQCMAGE